jgi:hypothetical protein
MNSCGTVGKSQSALVCVKHGDSTSPTQSLAMPSRCAQWVSLLQEGNTVRSAGCQSPLPHLNMIGVFTVPTSAYEGELSCQDLED